MKVIKKMWNYLIEYGQYITLFGGAITLFGTLLINQKSNKESAANSKKQDELNEKIIEFSNTITGGDSFPKVLFSSQLNHNVRFCITNNGNYDLDINSYSITAGDLVIPPYYLNSFRKPMPGLRIMKNTASGDIEFPFIINEQNKRFSIEFFAKNGRFVQRIVFAKIGDKWNHASIVNKEGVSDYLFKHIPNDFPEELNW